MSLSLSSIIFASFISLVATKNICPPAKELLRSSILYTQEAGRRELERRITQLNGGDPVERACVYFVDIDPPHLKKLSIPLDPDKGISNCEKESGFLIAQGTARDDYEDPTSLGIPAYLSRGFDGYRLDDGYFRYTSLPEWEDTCAKVDPNMVYDWHFWGCRDFLNRLGQAISWNLEVTAERSGLLNLQISLENTLFQNCRVGLGTPGKDYTAIYVGRWDHYIKVPKKGANGILSPLFPAIADSVLQPVRKTILGLSRARGGLSVEQATKLIVSDSRLAEICLESSSSSSFSNQFL